MATDTYAKLIFLDSANCPAGERMWVLVTRRLADGTYEGRLDNEPQCVRTVRPDDMVQFSPRHIIDIMTRDQMESHLGVAERAALWGLGIAGVAILAWKIFSRRR